MSQKRRDFLRSLGLAGLGLSINVTLTKAAPQLPQAPPTAIAGPRDLSPVLLNGKVHEDGKGIAGVAVTDGINVTLTDAKGSYSLASNATATFVYISIPRGYTFNHQKGITRFYQKIEPQKGRFKADFALQKLGVDDTKHNFIVWADPQIQNKEDAAQLNAQSAPDTRQLVNSYGKNALFHGIGCGDLVWDHFELFEDYKAAVEKTGIPFFQVIGNHDLDLDARTDDYSSDTFKKLFGPSYYSFNRGEVHYVVLDDVFFLGTSKKYIGYIPEHQFAWLEQDLATVKPGATVVVSVHIPVYTGAQRRNKAAEEPIGGVVSNRKELYRILKPYKAHIMSGHTHFNEKVFEGNTTEHVHGTVCGAWWTGPICYDGTPSGYGVYEVNGSDIQWYHKSVGKPKDHQFRFYATGTIADKPDTCAVNVWNWDPQWKVEWLEDGKAMGEMKREIALDPLSVELHAGTEKPARRAWVDPVLTDHMFFAQPSPSAQNITIQATDRFSNIYKKTFDLNALKGKSLVEASLGD
jgi:hypothetical protein